jgi:hypothetical protein
LITSQQSQDVRPTDDVDVTVEAVPYGYYVDFIEKLRPLGFTNDMNGPLCRFKVHGITDDIMPTEENILGFSNHGIHTCFYTRKLAVTIKSGWLYLGEPFGNPTIDGLGPQKSVPLR